MGNEKENTENNKMKKVGLRLAVCCASRVKPQEIA
jgi:hypothetical protein